MRLSGTPGHGTQLQPSSVVASAQLQPSCRPAAAQLPPGGKLHFARKIPPGGKRPPAGRLPSAGKLEDYHHPEQKLGGVGLEPPSKRTVTRLKVNEPKEVAARHTCSEGSFASASMVDQKKPSSAPASAGGVELQAEQWPLWLTFEDAALEKRFKVSRAHKAKQVRRASPCLTHWIWHLYGNIPAASM